jgi:hypothetical protein
MGATDALILLAVLLAVLLLLRRTATVRREVAEAESRLARRFYLLQGKVTEMEAVVRELEFERRRLRGEIRFAPSTRLSEALAVHPRVREILGGFGIAGSGCSGGSLDESRTLAETCAAASLDTRAVLDALGRFLQDPSAPVEARASAARIYRIQARPEAPR